MARRRAKAQKAALAAMGETLEVFHRVYLDGKTL
jgi:hypothetical protein